jgi:hypothetical protein
VIVPTRSFAALADDPRRHLSSLRGSSCVRDAVDRRAGGDPEWDSGLKGVMP